MRKLFMVITICLISMIVIGCKTKEVTIQETLSIVEESPSFFNDGIISDDEIFLVGIKGENSNDDQSTTYKGFLGKYDIKGKKVFEKLFDTSSSIQSIKKYNDNYVLAIRFSKGENYNNTLILIIDHNCEIIKQKILTNLRVEKMEVKDNKIICVGFNLENNSIFQLDSNLEILWEKTRPLSIPSSINFTNNGIAIMEAIAFSNKIIEYDFNGNEINNIDISCPKPYSYISLEDIYTLDNFYYVLGIGYDESLESDNKSILMKLDANGKIVKTVFSEDNLNYSLIGGYNDNIVVYSLYFNDQNQTKINITIYDYNCDVINSIKSENMDFTLPFQLNTTNNTILIIENIGSLNDRKGHAVLYK